MQDRNSLRISILTPSYNQGRYIEQAINSVLDQDYPNFEHIVIDGGSSDETIEVLNRYRHVKWTSEPDKGQSDALNKGLSKVTGDVVGWINADDFYAKGVFHRVAEEFSDRKTQWVVGDVVNYLEGSGIESYVRSREITYQSLLQNPDILRQQGSFFRSEFLSTAGGWKEELYMVMDLDLWLRLAKVAAPKMIHEKTAFFRMHEQQKSQVGTLLLQSREIQNVLRDHGAPRAVRVRNWVKKRYLWAMGASKQALHGC